MSREAPDPETYLLRAQETYLLRAQETYLLRAQETYLLLRSFLPKGRIRIKLSR